MSKPESPFPMPKVATSIFDPNTRTVKETDFNRVTTTRPMTDDEFHTMELERLQREHDNSPEVVLAECERRAQAFDADLLVLEDGFAVFAHVNCNNETVYIKAPTVALLSFTLGILNDEIH